MAEACIIVGLTIVQRSVKREGILGGINTWQYLTPCSREICLRS